MSLWICPSSTSNLELTILNTNVSYNGYKHSWAFNANRKNSWDELNPGDTCVFGNAKDGWSRMATVISKFVISDEDDQWPFRSPSGTPWRYGFALSTPIEININKEDFLSIFNRYFQSQTKIRNEEEIINLWALISLQFVV